MKFDFGKPAITKTNKVVKTKEVKQDPLLLQKMIYKDFLKEIVQQGINWQSINLVTGCYLEICQLFGPQDKWPRSIKKFYGRLNSILLNQEILDENLRQQRIYNAIKNQYLKAEGIVFTKRK